MRRPTKNAGYVSERCGIALAILTSGTDAHQHLIDGINRNI